MPAYIVMSGDVTDQERYDAYKALAPAAIARHGGRYLVRGGEMVALEGTWPKKRVVVLEFPDLDAARAFYDSAEYRAARKLREGAANLDMIAIAGV